ncbi:MAG TPA: hypothetical protein VFY17_08355 [Pilimelia sp.]|nr:hypothetical protein [Pilimelia sp.]
MSRGPADPDVRALAVAVRDEPPRLGAATRLVCLDGPSGAGKSTLALRLAAAVAALGPGPAPVVATDDLLDGWDDQFTFWPRFESQVLEPLRRGRPGGYRRYDWEHGRFGAEVVPVPATGVLIVEGVSAARSVIRPEATLTVFVTASCPVRRRRSRDRDVRVPPDRLRRWWEAEDAWFAADGTAAAADALYRTG